MSQNEYLREIVFDAMREVREMLPPGATLETGPEVPLIVTEGGALDSLGVVNLMVAVESRVEAAFGKPVSLVEALAEMPETSPFRTVSTLVEHLEGLIGDAARV